LTAVRHLAAEHGLAVVHATAEPVFGGSLRGELAEATAGRPVDDSVEAVLTAEAAAGVAVRSGLEAFGLRAKQSAAAVASYLAVQHAAGRRVLAYGAPSKASVLLGVSGVGPELLPFTVDASVAKHGLSI